MGASLMWVLGEVVGITAVGLAARRAVYYLGLMELSPEWVEMGPYYAAEWERRDTDAASS